MKLDENLHPLASGHRTALTWALRLKRETPDLEGDTLREWTAKVDEYWREELRFQLMAEEDCLLPHLAGHKAVEQLIRRSLKDHNDLDRLLYTATSGADEDTLRQALLDFGALLEAHVHFEEREVYQQAQKLLTPEQLKVVGCEVRELGVGIEEPYLPGEPAERGDGKFKP